MYNPQLETFIQVADAGSFNRAAAVLYISPTAATKQIDSLERRLNLKLFVRTHRGLVLTDAGKIIYSDAKHIIRFSKESLERARNISNKSEAVISVGEHFLTPVSYLMKIWPEIKKKEPRLRLKFVPFENRAETVGRIMRTLGNEVDLVLWIFDDLYISRWGCAGMELFREPVRIGVSMDSPLAEKDILTRQDLRGKSVMIMQRGWYQTFDDIRIDLMQNEPDVRIVEIPHIGLDTFNRCANEENMLMLGTDSVRDVHPEVKLLPVDWDYEMSFGILYPKAPSESMQLLLSSLEEMKDSRP